MTAPQAARHRADIDNARRASWRWRALVLAGFAVWIVRGAERFIHPTFWAEDGLIFFAQRSEAGLHSITISYAGYLHVVPRLSALALGPLPVALQLRAYVVVAAAVGLATLAAVLNPRLTHLLPTSTARAVTFLTLTLMPGLWESYGNLANLIFFGGICLSLVALADDPETAGGRLAEVIVVVLFGLSGPDVAMAVPIFAYRLWRMRSRTSAVVLLVATACAVVQYRIFLDSTRSTADSGTPVTLIRELLERVVGALLFGDSATMRHWDAASIAAEALWIVVIVACGIYALRRKAIVLVMCILLSFASAAYVYGSLGYTYPSLERHFMWPRVLVLLLAIATIWKMLERKRSEAGHRVAACAAVIVCLLFGVRGVVHDFRLRPYGPTPATAAFQQCLDHGHNVVCRLRTAPPGFVIQIPKP